MWHCQFCLIGYTTCWTCRSCHAMSWNIANRKRLTWPQAIHRLSHTVTRHHWISAAMLHTSSASCIPRIRTYQNPGQLKSALGDWYQSPPEHLIFGSSMILLHIVQDSHVLPFYLFCYLSCALLSLLESFQDSTLRRFPESFNFGISAFQPLNPVDARAAEQKPQR